MRHCNKFLGMTAYKHIDTQTTSHHSPYFPPGVSVVASAFAKSVTFRGTLLGPFCSFGAVWGADAKCTVGSSFGA